MIKNLKLIDGELSWKSDDCFIRNIDGGTYINDDNLIVIMNDKRNEVIVCNEKNDIIYTLCNSEKLYLMYLQKHPRYGLTVVASVKRTENDWSDCILALQDNEFKIVSYAR